MNFSQGTRGIVRALAIVLSVALPLAVAISEADARVGGGGSSGSRGSKTYSAPPSTTTAPGAAQPMNRTFTQPGTPGVGAPAAAGAANKGGFFNRPGMMGGMLGGLAMGFLGAGLFGMLFGGGFLSGLAGFASILGFIAQIALIAGAGYLLFRWWQRRQQPQQALAGMPRDAMNPQQPTQRSALLPLPRRWSSRSKSRVRTSKRSSACSARSRVPTGARTSARCAST
jgi:predicted lipid-binding transport protein (Tim44 family)